MALSGRAQAKTARCPCTPRIILDSSFAAKRSANVSRSLSFFVDLAGSGTRQGSQAKQRKGLKRLHEYVGPVNLTPPLSPGWADRISLWPANISTYEAPTWC